jgi:hypothetical protein
MPLGVDPFRRILDSARPESRLGLADGEKKSTPGRSVLATEVCHDNFAIAVPNVLLGLPGAEEVPVTRKRVTMTEEQPRTKGVQLMTLEERVKFRVPP